MVRGTKVETWIVSNIVSKTSERQAVDLPSWRQGISHKPNSGVLKPLSSAWGRWNRWNSYWMILWELGKSRNTVCVCAHASVPACTCVYAALSLRTMWKKSQDLVSTDMAESKAKMAAKHWSKQWKKKLQGDQQKELVQMNWVPMMT